MAKLHRCSALIWALVACAGCASVRAPRPTQARFQSHEDAAAVHVAVQSVAPFEEYVDSLQPKFTLSPEAALATAIPTSQLMELSEIRALLAEISLALPTATTTSTSTTEKGAAGVAHTEKVVSQTGPGSATPPAAPAVPAASRDPFSFTGRDAGLEPSLRYRSAAALLQEVALLSTYVKDAAVKSGTIPYIVRLLITVMPTARRAPYDVYTSVSFFGANEEPVVYGKGDARAFGLADIVSNTLDPEERSRRLASRSEGAAKVADGLARLKSQTTMDNSLACEGRPLDVIPLFVTDTVESSLVSAAREQTRTLGGGLAGLVANVGLGAAARSHAAAGARTLSQDVNGVYTLGRSSPNTLQVRLSAAVVDGTHHTLARTFSLSALVLMPAGLIPSTIRGQLFSADEFLSCRSAAFTARSILRDAETGAEIPGVGAQALKARIAAETRLASEEVDDRLLTAVVRGDYIAFRTLFRDAAAGRVLTEADTQMLWPDLVSAAGVLKMSWGTFDLPFGRFDIFVHDETRPLLDDGKVARLTLVGGQGLSPKGALTATMTVRTGNTSTPVPNTGGRISDDGTSAEITFPSLTSFPPGATVSSIDAAYRTLPPRWSTRRDPWLWAQDATPVIRVSPPDAPKPKFTIAARSSVLRVDAKGLGQLAFAVITADPAVAQVHAAVNGAVVTAVSPPVALDGPSLVLPTNKTYVFSVAGLVPGSHLRLNAWRMEGKNEVPATPVEVLVMR